MTCLFSHQAQTTLDIRNENFLLYSIVSYIRFFLGMMLHVGNPSVALPKSVMVVRWVLLFGLVVLATTTSSTTTTRMLSIGRNVLVSGFRPLPKSARRRTTPRTGTAANTSMGTTNRRQTNTHHPRRHLGFTASASTSSPGTRSRRRRTGVVVQNVYDDWRKCLVFLFW